MGGASMVAEQVTIQVVHYYLNSGDFNGISLLQLANGLGVEVSNLVDTVVELTQAEQISVVSPRQSNPFIKMLDVPIEEQLNDLNKRDPRGQSGTSEVLRR